MNIQNQDTVGKTRVPLPRNGQHNLGNLTGRPSSEKGVVLFMALIALVAMTIAALALVRSVDTTNLVAGNVALKQSAIQEADAGMNQAFNCLNKAGLLASGSLSGDQPTCNYYSHLLPDVDKPYGIPDVLKNVPVLSIPAINSLTGNTTRFTIERLCTATGPWKADICLDSPWGAKAGGGWHDVRRDMYSGGGTGGQLAGPQALYRISVMVSGPRNLKAYSQLIVNAPR